MEGPTQIEEHLLLDPLLPSHRCLYSKFQSQQWVWNSKTGEKLKNNKHLKTNCMFYHFENCLQLLRRLFLFCLRETLVVAVRHLRATIFNWVPTAWLCLYIWVSCHISERFNTLVLQMPFWAEPWGVSEVEAVYVEGRAHASRDRNPGLSSDNLSVIQIHSALSTLLQWEAVQRRGWVRDHSCKQQKGLWLN